ncbi:MAG TPA: hypothetical protein VFW30_02180 [Bryocella sp.]|nr:hypothetical protein [Bryocella sp.]
MLFTNLTSVSFARRFAGRFASFAVVALLAGTVASAQSSPNQSNPAPGTAPIQHPSSPSTRQSTGHAAPGTAPIKNSQAAAELAPGRGPSYQNRWDVYGGLAFANGQAGQNLPKRFNMGGGEGQFTYWLTHKLGLAGDYRWGGGTTPVFPVGAQNPVNFNRVLVMQNVFAGGVQYRGPKNRYVGINYHAFAGGDYGIFDYAVTHYPGVSTIAACPVEQPGQHGNLGLYCNHVAPWGAVGASIDFNQGQKFAVRLSPDLTFEHFGTETREFFGISLGVLYRGGR